MRKNLLWFVLLTLLTLPAIRDLLKPGYFSMHDDFQVMRQLGMDQCFQDGQIPCRWVPDAGFGFGYPMFNYYPPLPYYIGEIFTLVGIDLFWTTKILFILSFLFSGYFMFILARKLFGNFGGLISADFYIYAPYHSVDVYVRGALNEALSLVWFPLILYATYQLIVSTQTKKYLLLLAVSYASLLLSHNVMTLIFTPLLGFWSVFWILVSKNFKALKHLLLAGLWAIGLAAFFFLPVIVEKPLAHVESMTVGYFNYLAHYADLKQMFLSRYWGYGASLWGPEDEMAFPIGHLHWGLSFLVGAVFLALLLLQLFRRRLTKSTSLHLLTILLIPITIFYVFLIHSRSVWFWDHLPLLYYSQFPWRLLAIPAFTFSLIAGSVCLFLPKKIPIYITTILVISVIAWNFSFFRIQRSVYVTTAEKFSGLLWELQTTGGIFDYLPKTASRPPGNPSPLYPEYTKGNGGILDFQKGTNHFSFAAKVSSDKASLQLPFFDYQTWKITANGRRLPAYHDSDLGRLTIDLPQGTYFIKAKLTNTPIRFLSNLLSLVSLMYLLYFFLTKVYIIKTK